jgi:hypothetical protein
MNGNAVIRVYDDADNVIQTHEHKGDFTEPQRIIAEKWLETIEA